MQQKGGPAAEYFSTVWKQSGNTIMKQMLKQGMSKGASEIDFSGSGNSSKK